MFFAYFFSFMLSFGLKVDESRRISKIAFGSCTNQFNGNNPEIYYSITRFRPELFVWVGDVIYADLFRFPFRYPNPNFEAWNNKYNTLKSSDEYKALSNTSMITGVWDDHDYGINNGGRSFASKTIAKTLYLNFIDDGSIREHEGIYHSFSFKDLKLILLDIRWFRDDTNPDGDSLGEEQWAWLEKQLGSKEKLKIIANGLQVNTFDRIGPAEKWHEKSRLRLWELVRNYKGIILLSGDVHYAEILKVTCAKYPIFEITSSGMGHSVYTTYSWISWFILNFFQPFNFNVGLKFGWRNFGSIEIDWESGEIELAIRDTSGAVQNSLKFTIDEFYSELEGEAICNAGVLKLKFMHFAAVLCVFGLPFILLMLSGLIFIRKYSHSY